MADLAVIRAFTALKLLFVADSLAMPVHWYYNVGDIAQQFGSRGVTQFEKAPEYHPSSIMNLHSTSGGGRWTSASGAASSKHVEVVGNVILKGRGQFWNKKGIHYHHGMKAGENTLNAHCTRMLMRTLKGGGGGGIQNEEGGGNAAGGEETTTPSGLYNGEAFLNNYISFMTAEEKDSTHGDTYAESSHRGFFKNLMAGVPKEKAGAVTHDTASVGGLVMVAPIVFAERLRGVPLREVVTHCQQHVAYTHPDEGLKQIVGDYVGLLDALLFREATTSTKLSSLGAAQNIINAAAMDPHGAVRRDMSRIASKADTDVVGRLYSPACYISDSWPSILYFAFKYAGNSKAGLLANANVGGDNVHRGAVLGVIFGLIDGELGSNEEALWKGLKDKADIDVEIADLLRLEAKL